MNVTAVVPVKGTSTRVANKNTRLLAGKPLFLHTLEKLMSIDVIDNVYLDTESEEVIALAEHVDCKILRRDPRLASNATDGNKLLLNEIRQLEGDIFVQVLCTSPFLSPETISRSIDILKTAPEYDSVVAVNRQKQYLWNAQGTKPIYDHLRIPNSVDLDDTVVETMGLYAIHRKAALSTQRRIGERPFTLDVSPMEAVDVNYDNDFALAEIIACGLREREHMRLRTLTHLLSSTIISDTLDEMGYSDQVVQGLQLNLPNSRFFGRAKTLKIKAASPSDSTSIYDAYQTYSTIQPGDVIAVDTDVPDLAYFGNLNASIAIRSGAVGAIIDGHTRDFGEVSALGFPVYARGTTCKDVKSAGTFAYMNKRINIGGIPVEYESLIFADSDGIVVIPRKVEKELLRKAIDVVRKENRVLLDIGLNEPIDAILKAHGDF